MWLFSLPATSRAAIEADLVAVGWTFDDVPVRLPWRALFAFVAHLGPDSAYQRVTNPDLAFWMGGAGVQGLLATIADHLAVLKWQNTKDGHKNRRPPKPIKRPWSRPGGQQIGRGAIPAASWAAWWGDGK